MKESDSNKYGKPQIYIIGKKVWPYMHPDIHQPALHINTRHIRREHQKKNSIKTLEAILTSSPIKKTLGSADISSSSAEFSASLTVICTQL